MLTAPNQTRTLPIVLFAVFLDLLSNGILVPVVPQLLANPGSPYYMLPAAVPVAYAYILLGFLIAAFPIMQFFSTPILGQISDRYGRRPIFAISLLLTGVYFALFAWGIAIKSLVLLFAARILGGLSGGNTSVAQAIIADITAVKDRTRRFGMIGAAYGIGFIFGPVVGGVLSDPHIVHWFTPATPFYLATILSAISAASIWFLMPESHPMTEKVRAKVKLNWNKSVGNIIRAYNNTSVRAIFLTSFLFQAGITLFATFFTVFLIRMFGLTQAGVGYYIGYAGFWFVVVQVLVLRYISRRFDDVALLRFFLLAGALSILAYAIPNHISGLLVVGACFALTNGVSIAVLPSLISRRADANIQGEVLGVNASVQALAGAIPPIIAGFLAAEITPSAPIYIAGGVIALAWVAFVVFVKKEN